MSLLSSSRLSLNANKLFICNLGYTIITATDLCPADTYMYDALKKHYKFDMSSRWYM